MMKRSNLEICITIVIFLAGMGSTSFAEKIIYVDAKAFGANNGSSWTNAHNYLQNALADADSSAKPVRVLVAAGIYKPDQGANQEPGDREAAFRLINGVTIEGGYSGFTELYPNIRDISLYETILSGDLNGDDVMNAWLFKSDNSNHVTIGSGTDESAVLDGLTITGGHGSEGGGMYNANGSLTINNCTFIRNEAHRGGAIYNTEGSNPLLRMCVFSQNYVRFEQNTGSGGAIYNQNSDPVLLDCTFSLNGAYWQGVGGAISNYDSNPMLISCEFTANVAEASGGAIFNERSGPTVVNCIFTANTAEDSIGGGMDNDMSCPALINCTFAANRALSGVVLSFRQSQLNFEPDLCRSFIFNCILWEDGTQIWNGDGSTLGIAYSNVKNGQATIYDPYYAVDWGEGNIDVDPCFASPGYWIYWNGPDVVVAPSEPYSVWVDGDYRLQSQAGRWDPTIGVWVQDEVTSPCIDAGDIGSPFVFEPLPNGGRINMGAYGGTSEASKSPFLVILPEQSEGQQQEEKEL